MTVTLHSFLGIYGHALDVAAHLLDKGAAFARDSGLDPETIAGWRLSEDMHPLAFQIGVVVNFSRSFPARAAGLPVPEAIDAGTLDIAGLHAAIAIAKADLAAIGADQLVGRDDVPLTVKLGDVMEPTLPAAQWLTGFATTNIHFHMSMTYAILRAKGVPIGKIDLFPTGL